MIQAALFSLAVGLSVGWTGIGGFLLLILFGDILHLSAGESLFLAFSMFLLEGLVGAFSWYRKKIYQMSEVTFLSVGAFVGAIAGALVGKGLDEQVIKTILYVTVLVSGISVFLRDVLFKDKGLQKSIPSSVLVLLGFLVALVCSISGAGGPVLMIPLLVALGMDSRKALSLSITSSVFIAAPALVIYGTACSGSLPVGIFLISFVFHLIGLVAANMTSDIVKAGFLKYFVAVFSVSFSLIKLFL